MLAVLRRKIDLYSPIFAQSSTCEFVCGKRAFQSVVLVTWQFFGSKFSSVAVIYRTATTNGHSVEIQRPKSIPEDSFVESI